MRLELTRQLTAAAIAAALLAQPVVLAMPADTTKTENYGESGDWTLRRTIANGTEVVSCDMYLITDSERGLRFNYGGGSGALGFSGYATAASEAPMDVEIWFDDKRDNSSVVTMTLEEDSEGFGWRSYTASNDEPDPFLDDMLHNSAEVSFAYMVPGEGENVETYSLDGYATASGKTTDCVNAPKPVAAAKPKAKRTAGEPYVIKGSCKLVVDGKTYVDIKKTCSIWMVNDGTGAFWINTDRESSLGDYFAEVTPAGDGTASGHWNGMKGATHAQAFLGEDFRMKKGGCWANKRASICAAK